MSIWPALAREFDRVFQQVPENLLEGEPGIPKIVLELSESLERESDRLWRSQQFAQFRFAELNFTTL